MEYTGKTCYTSRTMDSQLKIPPADATYVQVPLQDLYTIIDQLSATDCNAVKPAAKELYQRWKKTLGIK
jgi:hypothetical protein